MGGSGLPSKDEKEKGAEPLFLMLDNISGNQCKLVVRQGSMARRLHVPVHLEDKNAPILWRPVGQGGQGVALNASGCKENLGRFCGLVLAPVQNRLRFFCVMGGGEEHQKDEKACGSGNSDEKGKLVRKWRC